VLDANVGGKLFVTVGFVLPLHFIKRMASERTRRIELPVTLSKTVALKIRVRNPFEFAWYEVLQVGHETAWKSGKYLIYGKGHWVSLPET
jgi:hypothetical protein